MSGEEEKKPIRRFVAVTAYRAVWWPICAVLIPMVALGAFVDWLSWRAFPAIAKAAQPGVSALHNGALAVAGLIYGRQSTPAPDCDGAA